ncbi:hypothetical protein JW935_24935 [candidate division KSB1 bacterium]|nr:hypothetical protein [candidate division KSB1 bacterium]
MRFIHILLAVSIIGFTGCSKEKKPTVDSDKLRSYAGDLVNNKLYEQAISVYIQYLNDYSIEKREQANVNYIIADLYADRIKNYENALAYYLKVKHLYPESSLMEQVNKKIVMCLERLERSEDAQQALDEAVQLDPTKVKKKRPGAVVARIGTREVTQGDLDFELQQLPPSIREQLTGRDKKIEFLREYVATELLYDTAQRASLDKDPDVIEGAFQAKKALMVRKLLEERVAAKVKIENSDIELYFQAHKDKYAEKDENGNIVREKQFSEVTRQVASDLYQQRYQEAYLELIEKMIRTEEVQFFESRIQ